MLFYLLTFDELMNFLKLYLSNHDFPLFAGPVKKQRFFEFIFSE